MNSDCSSRCKLLALLAVVLLALGGCSRPAHQRETAPVSGRVTLNGQPVTSGYIYTSPRKGRLATGRIAGDGSFRLGTYSESDGAAIGEHAVMLAPVPSDEGPVPEDAIVPPARYASASSSGLTITVPPEGLADYLIELEASPKSDSRSSNKPQPIE